MCTGPSSPAESAREDQRHSLRPRRRWLWQRCRRSLGPRARARERRGSISARPRPILTSLICAVNSSTRGGRSGARPSELAAMAVSHSRQRVAGSGKCNLEWLHEACFPSVLDAIRRGRNATVCPQKLEFLIARASRSTNPLSSRSKELSVSHGSLNTLAHRWLVL